MDDRGWGPGSKTDEPAFALGHLDDGTPFELIFGEYPHSRSDNNIYARFPSAMGAEGESIVGFDGHRVLVGVEVRTMNYLKSSGMSGDEVRKGGEYRISFNGEVVYTGFVRDALHALLLAHRKLSELLEHSSHLWEGSPVGRAVYYHGAPAVIDMWIPDQGCVVLRAVDGEFPRMPWHDYDDERDRVKDDVLSPHIWWFRDEKKAEPSQNDGSTP